MTLSVGILIFQGFEVLDVFGPVELLATYPEHFEITMVGEQRGAIRSAQGPSCIAEEAIGDGRPYDMILVPGGQGTRTQVGNPAVMRWLQTQAVQAQWVTSVCTGSALLAKAGILNGRKATSNKMSFKWVASQGPEVNWDYGARWVEDGNILTSSGVSAGMDMTLGLIANLHGKKAAEDAALWAEYSWHRDAATDPFAGAWENLHPA